jgi:hemolysin III
LLTLAPERLRAPCLIFVAASVLLFTTSAFYHRGNWGPRASAVLRRMDHSNIFLMIAGTYTPVALALLPPEDARTLLAVVWTGAALGVVFRVAWSHAPRMLYTPLYVLLGWAALWYLPAMGEVSAGSAVLLVVGGLAYSAGAAAYAFKRPDPWPRTFGFHEVFHGGTLVGYLCHYAAVVAAVLVLR